MPAKCTVCEHEEINAINEKLITGLPVRKLAEQYSLGRMALSRHRSNHLPKLMVKAKDLQEADAADKLLEKVTGLYDKSLEILAKAESTGKYQPAVGAIKEARANLELIAKLIGELKTGTHINITYNQEFIDLRTQIVNALEPFPEARLKVAEVLMLEAGNANDEG